MDPPRVAHPAFLWRGGDFFSVYMFEKKRARLSRSQNRNLPQNSAIISCNFLPQFASLMVWEFSLPLDSFGA